MGDNHPDYASSLNNLAVLYNDIGDFTNAQIYYNQALEIEKNIQLIKNYNNWFGLNYAITYFYRT